MWWLIAVSIMADISGRNHLIIVHGILWLIRWFITSVCQFLYTNLCCVPLFTIWSFGIYLQVLWYFACLFSYVSAPQLMSPCDTAQRIDISQKMIQDLLREWFVLLRVCAEWSNHSLSFHLVMLILRRYRGSLLFSVYAVVRGTMSASTMPPARGTR